MRCYYTLSINDPYFCLVGKQKLQDFSRCYTYYDSRTGIYYTVGTVRDRRLLLAYHGLQVPGTDITMHSYGITVTPFIPSSGNHKTVCDTLIRGLFS